MNQESAYIVTSIKLVSKSSGSIRLWGKWSDDLSEPIAATRRHCWLFTVRAISSVFFLFVLLYGPHIAIKCCLRGQKNNTPAIINCTQKLKGWLRTLCDFAQHNVNWVQTEQEQTDRKEARWRRCESGTESWCYCPAGLVISQMAGSISSPWKGQHSKLQDLPTGPGKRDKKGKKIKLKKKIPYLSCPSAGQRNSQKRISHSLMYVWSRAGAKW